jgi:hypothetical protein
MDEQGIGAVPIFNELNQFFRIRGAWCREAVHHFHNVMKGQFQMLIRCNAFKIMVRCFGSQKADNAADRMGIDQPLNRAKTANNNHHHTSNLNFLRNSAAASMGGNGFRCRNFRDPSPLNPRGRPKNFSASGTEKPASWVASR